MFRRFHPEPGLLNLFRMEVVRLGREQNRSVNKRGDDVLPLARADQGDPRNVIGVSMQEAQFFPTSSEVDAVHLRHVGEDPQRSLLALLDREFQLRFEGLDLFGGHFAGNFESKRPTAAFF